MVTGRVFTDPPWSSTRQDPFERLNILKHWLTECDGSHDTCRSTPTAKELPKRFLDLMPEGWSTSCPDVRLVSTRSLPTNVRYMTLSHSWGQPSQHPLKTTRQTQPDHSIRISFTALPPMFQDTVTVARQLQVRYLWIDSLCIVQDDDGDWQEEAAKMASVYSASYLTIAPCDFSSSQSGFLSSLSAVEQPLVVREPLADSDRLKRYNHGDILMRILPRISEMHKYVEKTVLWERGWVLQEQALSRRVLQIAQNMLFWSCNRFYRSECEDDDGISGPLFQNDGYLDLQNAPTSRLRVQWQNCVESYSRRHLTRASDRLAAFAGLIDGFSTRLGHQPMLGLWKETAHLDLSWTLHRSPISVNSPSGPIPSWSWLSRVSGQGPCPVGAAYNRCLGEAKNENFLRIISFLSKWSGRPMTSTLLSADLVVSGLVRKVHVKDSATESHKRLHLMEAWSVDTESNKFLGLCKLDDPDVPIDDLNRAGESIILLHLNQRKDLSMFYKVEGRYKRAKGCYMAYLVLRERLDSNGLAVYSRIGVGGHKFKMSSDDGEVFDIEQPFREEHRLVLRLV